MPVDVRMSFPGSEIYSSRAIVVRDRQPLTIEIIPPNSPLNERYEVRLHFSTIEGQEGGVKWEHSANGGLDLNIINFDSPLGVTTHTPINVGSYQERDTAGLRCLCARRTNSAEIILLHPPLRPVVIMAETKGGSRGIKPPRSRSGEIPA